MDAQLNSILATAFCLSCCLNASKNFLMIWC